MSNLAVEWVAIQDLFENPANPRHNEAAVDPERRRSGSARNERARRTRGEANPEDVWTRRTPITVEERTALREDFDTHLARLQAEEHAQDLPWRDRRSRATLERRALTNALIQRGYLVIRKGRVRRLNRRRKRQGVS